MRSNTIGFNDVAGHYLLLSYEVGSERLCASSHKTLAALARAAFSLPVASVSNWYAPERHVNLRAFAPSGKALDISEVLAYGRNLERVLARWWFPPCKAYVRRLGPVPGVHKYGGRGYRRFAHMRERRNAALVLAAEGEVAPRAARSADNIPNPRDYERCAPAPRCWKSQRKGRKAWDRPGRPKRSD